MGGLIPALILILAYLIGAIPFGLLIVRAVKGIDVRTVGSGNIGATNVKRVLGTKGFIGVLVLDALKGLIPPLAAPWLAGALGLDPVPPWLPVGAALAAIVGHNFPVYLGFKGGKGVATSLGAVLALDPIGALIAAGAFVFFLVTTRYMSISSLLGALAFGVAWFARARPPFDRAHAPMSLFVLLAVTMMIVRHRANVGRLLAGTEPKFWGTSR